MSRLCIALSSLAAMLLGEMEPDKTPGSGCSVQTRLHTHAQAMRGIRQSAKYRARLKELLEEQDAAVRPLGKARKQGSRARK